MGELQARSSRSSRRRYARSSAGGASSTGAGPRRRQCCGDASGCCGEWRAARCDGEELVSSHTKGLCSELSEARPRYGAAVAKVKKLQADFEATLSELHFGGKRVNLMGAINAL